MDKELENLRLVLEAQEKRLEDQEKRLECLESFLKCADIRRKHQYANNICETFANAFEKVH